MGNQAQHTASRKRESKLVNDIGIYAIGNLGSKVITFLMVPLYTYFVEDTADFGYYDFCLQIVLLLLPFFTLQLRDGAFRFLLDAPSDDERRRIVTMVYRTLFFSTLITVAITLAVASFCTVSHLWYILGLLIAMGVQEVVAQVFRGLGNNKAFVSVSILSAFGIGLFSLIFVAGLGWGIKGIFLANIFARLCAIAIVEIRLKTLRQFFGIKVSNKQVTRDILRYTLPLLPGSICWWLTGSSDRWFIKEFLGYDVNGVYAVAFRFVSIMQTLAIIFYQAWQETAILQYHSPDRNNFFSKIFNSYAYLLCALLIAFGFGLKLCYGWLVDDNYQSGAAFLYPLGISAVIFALSAFFDMGYQCAKDTARTLPAIILSAIVNVTCNFILVRIFGIYGVIATSIISYLVLLIYRWFDCKRYFILRLSRETLMAVALALVCIMPFYLNASLWLDALTLIAAMAMLAACCPATLKKGLVQKFAHK